MARVLVSVSLARGWPPMARDVVWVISEGEVAL